MTTTLEEIRNQKRDYVTPRQAADVFGMTPYAFNVMAQEGTLPFPAVLSGTRVKIPREAFVRFCEGAEITARLMEAKGRLSGLIASHPEVGAELSDIIQSIALCPWATKERTS